MVSGNKKKCELAKKYYYDMLDPDTIDKVPENIQDHIANCLYCVRKLAQLYQLLSDLAHYNQKEPTNIRPETSRYFPLYEEQQVDCKMVKEFLPLLVDPEPEIQIPTFANVHLDQCPQCKQDFEILRSLKLNSKQLSTLAEFLSQSSFQNSFECSVVGKSIKAVAEMRFGQVSSDTLNHICLCKNCRTSLYKARQTMIEKVSEELKKIQFQPFEVEFRDVGVFPSLKRINVIWIGIKKGVIELTDLYSQIESKLNKIGFRPETRGFRPHITVARVRSARNKKKLAETIINLQNSVFGSLIIDSVKLRRSILMPMGPLYSTLFEVRGINK